MSLFLLLAIPLTIFAVLTTYLRSEVSERRRWIHGLIGLLLAVPVIFAHTLIRKPFPGTLALNELFRHVFFYQQFQLFLLALFVFHLSFGFREKIRERKYRSSDEWQVFFFFSVFYAAVSVVDGVLLYGEYNAAILFYEPLMRIAIIFSLTVLVSMFREETGIKKVLLLFAMMVVPAAASFGYPFFYLQNFTVAIPITVFCVAGSYAGFHFWMVKRYRPETVKGSSGPVISADKGRAES